MVFYPLALTKVGNAKYKTSLIKQHIYFALFYLCRCWLHDMRGTILTFFSLVEKLCKLLITVYSMITWAYLSCICMQPLWNIKKVVPLPRYSTLKNYCNLYIIQTFRYKVMHSLLAMHLLAHSLIHTITHSRLDCDSDADCTDFVVNRTLLHVRFLHRKRVSCAGKMLHLEQRIRNWDSICLSLDGSSTLNSEEVDSWDIERGSSM